MDDLPAGHYAYILSCADGTLYIGYTPHLHERIAAHNAGKGAKYTRARLPVTLLYYEAYPDKSAAMKREYVLKRLTREKKLELIELRKQQ